MNVAERNQLAYVSMPTELRYKYNQKYLKNNKKKYQLFNT